MLRNLFLLLVFLYPVLINGRKITEGLQDFVSKCPGNCSKHGTCNEELRRCDCPLTYTGEHCETPTPDLSSVCAAHRYRNVELCNGTNYKTCLNRCNGRGRCIGNFCHCHRGYYGADCSLSLDKNGKPVLLAGQNYTIRKRGPRIYVYELPPSFNQWFAYTMDRPLILPFWQRLLAAGVRTADPETADYFFVPVNHRSHGDDARVMGAIQYIEKNWPYWTRLEGARHIFFELGDMGRIETSDEVRDVTQKSIWLTHWGLTEMHRFSRWPAAHRPGLDIVLPIMTTAHQFSLSLTPLNPKNPQRERKRQFFLAGRICGHGEPAVDKGERDICNNPDAYSGGVRAKVFYHHHARPDWTIVRSTPDAGEMMAETKFCLAPPGGGHGKRQVLTTLQGCVPVLIGDNILQPFEPEMRWSDFAVPVPEADISKLHLILGNISESMLKTYQERIKCQAQHLFYTTLLGTLLGDDGRYDAVETLFAILRTRTIHPDWPPEKYQDDPEFKAFMNCASDQDPLLNPLPRNTSICYAHVPVTLIKKQLLQCTPGCRKVDERVHLAGGPYCCHEDNFAACHRTWQ